MYGDSPYGRVPISHNAHWCPICNSPIDDTDDAGAWGTTDDGRQFRVYRCPNHENGGYYGVF